MKKLFFFILTCTFFSTSFGKQYFIANNGNDTNLGTIESPFLGFDAAYSAAQPGDTIWVRGGVYNVSTIWKIEKAGNVNAYYNLWGYTPDIRQGDSVILNISATNGIRITLDGKYWHIKNLVIQNADDNGMRIEGSYNIIENCVFRYNSDSGLTIQQSNGTMPNDGTIAAFNLILNCDSYYNDKNVSNADGFACKLSPGAGNVFRGCRSWANGDDGFDFYYSRFQIIVEDCWTFRNGLKGGNGNGFKSNGSASSSSTPRTQAPHVYIRCIAFDHKYTAGSNNKGFDQNHNEGNVTMINCLSFDNEKNYAYQEDTQNGKNHVLRNCVGFEPYSETLGRTLLPGEIINPGTKNEISYESSNTWFGNTVDAAYNSWNLAESLNNGWNPSRDDYESLELADAIAERQADGSLPDNSFGKLKPESQMKDAGISYTWELSLPLSSYPNNPTKPYYVKSTLVTTDDGMPDLGPFEIPSAINPFNQSPIVNITAPQAGSEFNLNDVILLQADAMDVDGNIARVEFYVNNNLIGISYASPYTYDWTCSIAGDYTVMAKAYDNEGAFSNSEVINITVKNANTEGQLGEKKLLLKLSGISLTDEIQNKPWSTVNSVSISNNHIKLTYSSSKGGTIISPFIDMSKYLPDSLNFTFASSGGGNRNLNVYVSSDGGATYSAPYLQAGAANNVAVPVKMKLSDKVSGEGNFVLKLEAAGTVEVWNVEVSGYEKIESVISSPAKENVCIPIVSSGKLILKMNLTELMPFTVDIYNMQGVKMFHQKDENSQKGINEMIININSYPSGMYIIKLNSGKDNFTSKFIKP